MKLIVALILLAAIPILAGDIIPVAVWPQVLNLPDKQIVNASISDCVKAGYRMIPPKPPTPVGKRIKSETFVQDPDNEAMVKYAIVYEDIPPPPPPPPPEVLTNIVIGKISISFTADTGAFRGIRWLGAPATN